MASLSETGINKYNLQASIQYKLLRKRIESWSNFKTQIFIYSNDKDVARIFLFSYNKICNVFLSKVKQIYCYIQLCINTEMYLKLLVTN